MTAATASPKLDDASGQTAHSKQQRGCASVHEDLEEDDSAAQRDGDGGGQDRLATPAPRMRAAYAPATASSTSAANIAARIDPLS